VSVALPISTTCLPEAASSSFACVPCLSLPLPPPTKHNFQLLWCRWSLTCTWHYNTMLLRGARSKHDMHNWSCYTFLAASASLVWAFLCICFLVLDCPSQLLQYQTTLVEGCCWGQVACLGTERKGQCNRGRTRHGQRSQIDMYYVECNGLPGSHLSHTRRSPAGKWVPSVDLAHSTWTFWPACQVPLCGQSEELLD